MLWLFAEEMGVSIRKYKDAVVTNNRATFASRITRQTCVSYRMHIPAAHAPAHLKTRGDFHVAIRWNTFVNQLGNSIDGERRRGLRRARLTAFQLGPCEKAVLDCKFRKPGE